MSAAALRCWSQKTCAACYGDAAKCGQTSKTAKELKRLCITCTYRTACCTAATTSPITTHMAQGSRRLRQQKQGQAGAADLPMELVERMLTRLPVKDRCG